MVKIVFSESRNCLIQLDTNQTAWVTYEDSLHACVQCVATNQRPIASEIISINELETSKCCNGQITLKEDCLEGSTSLQCHNLTEVSQFDLIILFVTFINTFCAFKHLKQ